MQNFLITDEAVLRIELALIYLQYKYFYHCVLVQSFSLTKIVDDL